MISSRWFMVCAVVAVSGLLTADIVAVKLVSIFGYVVPGGAIVYPLTFIMDDIITEVYGYHAARRVIWFGLLANVLFVIAAQIVLILTPRLPTGMGSRPMNESLVTRRGCWLRRFLRTLSETLPTPL